MKFLHIVSVSGGKDSAATLLLALAKVGKDSVRAIFCDTGNEHDAVYEYLNYLERTLAIKIDRLKADFSERIAAKRQFIARDQRIGRDKQGRKKRWTNKAKRRALAALVPSGNPYLDLCMWKGRFPSRKVQFCTEELKRNMAVEYQLDWIDRGYAVVSWQGVRRDESHNRRNAKKSERVGPRLYTFRPIVDWSAADVFAYCASRGIVPNPLYLQGMGRVGCMPCINARKQEIREIAARFPNEIARISEWEKKVAACAKRGFATFFASNNSPVEMKGKQDNHIFSEGEIHQVVRWAKTTRGGKNYNLLDEPEPSMCASAYGLCE
jgi:3'-phosphoadenosine 5'-phosphosulfate sulfotransferase (PAPS reductase)/FAD synthetase